MSWRGFTGTEDCRRLGQSPKRTERWTPGSKSLASWEAVVGFNVEAAGPADEDGHPVAVHALHEPIVVSPIVRNSHAGKISSPVDVTKRSPEKFEEVVKAVLVAVAHDFLKNGGSYGRIFV